MATLNISDLSVGDWVYHDFYEVDVRVKTIYGDTERIIAESNDGYGVTCHLDNFNPIPITPEILEANGWERNEEDEYMEYYGDPTSSIAHTKGTFHYRLEAPEVSVVCYSVHQLQHALRLAGVDKEIVMPKKMKTKYNIGDEVWVVALNQVLMKEVVKVRIVGINEKYGYEVTSDTWLKHGVYEELRLFPTKEELLKSL